MNRFLVVLVLGLVLIGGVLMLNYQEGRISDSADNPEIKAAGTEDPVAADKREVIGSQEGRPYSSAVKIRRAGQNGAGETLYVSGQVGADPSTGEKVEGDIRAETRQVLTNLQGIVESAGFQISDAVRCTVYLLDMDDYSAVNEVYMEFFPKNPPSRACVGVSQLVRDFRIEISLVAEK